MSARLLTTLLSIWLLAGLQGLGLHVHWHSHLAEANAHSHVASAFDDDHEQAHADGAVDEQDDRSGLRAAPEFTPLVDILVSTLLLAEPDHEPLRYVEPESVHLTGPPPDFSPPGQAPPSFAFA